jgi:hypothetical protein
VKAFGGFVGIGVKIASFDDVLQVLGRLDLWLQRLGIPIRDDRWHQAVATVQRIRERSEIITRGGSVAPPPSDNFVEGLFEALEIFEILTAFEGETSDALRTKVARAVSGPVSPLAEQPKNSEARNTMFELSLAAGWKNKGLDVELGEPDMRVTVESRAFRVECKRPFSENSVRANIRGAHSQLSELLELPGNQEDFGIVAISLSRVFTKGNLTCFAPAESGRSAIRQALEGLLRTNADPWGLRGFRHFHRRVPAVLFNLATPWDIGGQQLIHLSTSDFRATHTNGAAWQALTESFERLGERT